MCFFKYFLGPAIFHENITSINLEHNQIDKIPYGIFSRAKSLTKLNMKENSLVGLVIFYYLNRLMIFEIISADSTSTGSWYMDKHGGVEFGNKFNFKTSRRHSMLTTA